MLAGAAVNGLTGVGETPLKCNGAAHLPCLIQTYGAIDLTFEIFT